MEWKKKSRFVFSLWEQMSGAILTRGRHWTRKRKKCFCIQQVKANGSDGVGSLSAAAPGANESADSYAYDPANPVQTRGGPLCCAQDLILPGPKDQTSIEKRHDILIYSTELLAQNLDVTGPVTVELFVKSSAVDTDFTAKLVDVHPDGYAQNITEGILRMRYLDSREKPGKITPGQIYKITVDLVATQQRISRRPSFAVGSFQQ